jgi:hypothetical protein
MSCAPHLRALFLLYASLVVSHFSEVPTIQVMWCIIRQQKLFVVASSLGVQIFDEDGRVCKFSHPCRDVPDVGGSFARGLAVIGPDMLCVG